MVFHVLKNNLEQPTGEVEPSQSQSLSTQNENGKRTSTEQANPNKKQKNNDLSMLKESFYQYLVCSLIMWMYPQKRIGDYWKDTCEEPLKGNRVIPTIMSSKKWKKIHSILDFDNNGEELINMLNQANEKHYVPNSDMSIDETVLFSKAKNPLKVSMPCKPKGIGFKLYSLADKNGFLYKAIIFTKEKNKVCSLVTRLVELAPKTEGNPERPIQHTFVMDSFYGSEDLANKLHNRGVAFLMVMKKSSDISIYLKDLINRNINKGDWIATHTPNGILAVYFCDKKDFFLLTNCSKPDPVKQGKDGKKSREIPVAVDIYNQLMCGVDMVDSGISGKTHKIKGWKKVLVHYMFRIAVNNAWRYWRVKIGRKISLFDFITEAIYTYIKGRKLEIGTKHLPVKASEQNFSKNSSNLRCVMCKIEGTKSYTTLVCPDCKVPLHMHCFSRYHNKQMEENINLNLPNNK
jgi:Transposase IS4